MARVFQRVQGQGSAPTVQLAAVSESLTASRDVACPGSDRRCRVPSLACVACTSGPGKLPPKSVCPVLTERFVGAWLGRQCFPLSTAWDS